MRALALELKLALEFAWILVFWSALWKFLVSALSPMVASESARAMRLGAAPMLTGRGWGATELFLALSLIL
jgi:hypothetical protein